jgi:hypothetical protein
MNFHIPDITLLPAGLFSIPAGLQELPIALLRFFFFFFKIYN